MELHQGGEVAELLALQPLDSVVLQVQHLKLCEAVEGLVIDGLNAAAVEEQVDDPLAADEGLALERAHKVVAVQVDGGGVHGDEGRDLGVAPHGALDDVLRPGRVVEAGAALGALHAAVTGKEVAAHAEGEAVGLVLAQELPGVHGGYRLGRHVSARVVAGKVDIRYKAPDMAFWSIT